MKKYYFKNYECGELCPINGLYLEMGDEANEIIQQMDWQDWQLLHVDGKKVYTTCDCGSPIFQPDCKYCKPCSLKMDAEARQMKFPIF